MQLKRITQAIFIVSRKDGGNQSSPGPRHSTALSTRDAAQTNPARSLFSCFPTAGASAVLQQQQRAGNGAVRADGLHGRQRHGRPEGHLRSRAGRAHGAGADQRPSGPAPRLPTRVERREPSQLRGNERPQSRGVLLHVVWLLSGVVICMGTWNPLHVFPLQSLLFAFECTYSRNASGPLHVVTYNCL